jgi:hypothetical protein
MKGKINSYFAVLIITVVGAAATQLIVHVVYANTFTIIVAGSAAEYVPLQRSILGQ